MTIQKVLNDKNSNFKVLNEGNDLNKEISTPFCCDLLSIAMSKAPANCAWITIMGNINTLAVASLTDCACIIIAEGIIPDNIMLEKAGMEGITILSTQLPIFNASLEIYNLFYA